LQATKKYQTFVPPNKYGRQKWPLRRTKYGEISIVISVQEKGVIPMGVDPPNRVGDQDIGSPGRPVFSGLHVPSKPGKFVQEQDPLFISLHAGFFLQNAFQLNQQ
jgi:hypothetical protein